MSVQISLTQDLDLCFALRDTVFIQEQGVSLAEEQDGQDAQALHFLVQDLEQPVGTARVLIKGDTAKIGRICVLKSHRGQGLGGALVSYILSHLAERADLKRARLGAQTHAIGFYEKLGFQAQGAVYLDAGIAHKDMEITL